MVDICPPKRREPEGPLNPHMSVRLLPPAICSSALSACGLHKGLEYLVWGSLGEGSFLNSVMEEPSMLVRTFQDSCIWITYTSVTNLTHKANPISSGFPR